MNDNRDHLRALLAAYNEAVGIDLDLDRDRMEVLREVDKKGLTPADVRAVALETRRLVASDDKRYTDSSLLFENLLGRNKRDHKVGRFQSLALLLRKRRKLGAAAGAAAPVAPPLSDADAERLREQRRVEMEKLRREIGR
jgi:hypothetical protein